MLKGSSLALAATMKNKEERETMAKGFDFDNVTGIKPDEKELARRQAIGGQVKNPVLLSEFEDVPSAGSTYDTLEIEEYRNTSVKMKLPPIVTNSLAEKARLDIKINHVGDILLLLYGEGVDTSHEVSTAGKSVKAATIYSPRLAAKLRDKGVKLPAKYTVTAEEKIVQDSASIKLITGWVCRRKV